MPLLVRWATRWDRKALVEMLSALAADHGTAVEAEALSASFDWALGHPDRMRYAVAQRDDQVVGMAMMQDAFSSWQAAPFGIIEDFYVLPDARGQGVGTEILALLVQEAQRRGYCRVELQVQEDNDAAWRFYESRGLRFTGCLVYARELRDDPPEA